MVRSKWVAVTVAVVLGGSAAWAQKAAPSALAYLLTSSAEDDTAVSSWGFNAIDGKSGTAWCTGPDGVGQRLVLAFAKTEHITHVGVLVGALDKGKLDPTRGRVRELELSNGEEKRSIPLRDIPSVQEMALSPPLNARKLVVTIKDAALPAVNLHASVCLGELALRDEATVLTGESLVKPAKAMGRAKIKLTGPWLDEPSAPERFLTLALDGTFAWRFEPLMDGEALSMQGTWDLTDGKLILKPKGGKPMMLDAVLNRVAGRSGTFEQLELTGTEGPAKLPGNYRPAP